jgi:hypothetical protein
MYISSCQWIFTMYALAHELINHIDTKAKCHLNKLTGKGTLRQVFICLRSRTPYPRPHTLYVYVYSIRSILFHTGKGGGGRVEPERRSEGQQYTKLGRKCQHAVLCMI